MEKDFVNFKKSRDIGAILSDAFKFLRFELKGVFSAILIYVGPMVLIYAISAAYYVGAVQRLAGGNIGSTNPFDNIPIKAALFMGISMLFAMAMTTALVNSYIWNYVKKGKNGFTRDDVWEKAKPYIFPYMGYSIAVAAILVLTAITIVIPFLLFVNLSLIFVVSMFEKKGIGDSFSRSSQLVKNNWWFTFGVYILSNLIISAVSFVSGLIQGGFQVFQLVSGLDEDVLLLQMIIMGIMYFFQFFLYTYTFVVLAMHYYNLVERKEAPSLLERINRINRVD